VALAAQYGITRRSDITDQEIVERLLYPLINEGALILSEGIAYRGADIDMVWVAGYGFPDHRGGPLFLADEIGLSTIAERMAVYARERGNAFGYWSASDLLKTLAAQGKRLSDSSAS
jgi:3-hydroxyacyl-CoA dehydrogenase